MKKIKKRELLKYDYTNKIKVVFDDSYKSSAISYFYDMCNLCYIEYIDKYSVNIFDINSFIFSLGNKLFLHSVSMLEVIYYISGYYKTDLYFEYNNFNYFFPAMTLDNINYFYDFIFVMFVDLKSINSFYKFVRTIYKSLYISLQNLLQDDLNKVVCNDTNLILHFKDISNDKIISNIKASEVTFISSFYIPI